MSELDEFTAWDDLSPGDRCHWQCCDEPATVISASLVRRAGITWTPSGSKWCARHRPSEVERGGVRGDAGGEDARVLFFPGRPILMNANRARHHWQDQRRATKALRTEAAYEALSAALSHFDAVEVTSYPTYANRRSWPDVGAWAPATKAIIDGLVDADVLDDDGPEVVRALHYLAPQLGERDGLVVEIRPISP